MLIILKVDIAIILITVLTKKSFKLKTLTLNGGRGYKHKITVECKLKKDDNYLPIKFIRYFMRSCYKTVDINDRQLVSQKL